MSKLLKTIMTFMLAFLLCTALVACDETGGDGDGATVTGEFIYELEKGENEEGEEYDYYKITGYTVTSEDSLKMAEGDFSFLTSTQRNIKIPATYKNLPVEEIASMAFAEQVILQSVDFTDSNIKTIGVGAFSGCTSLEEIKNLPFIGKSEDAVGEERVMGHLFGSASTSDKNTTVSAKAYYEVAEPDLSFNVPTSLKKVSTTATEIPECAFYGFSMVEEVTYVNATEIGKGAFSGCSLLLTADLSKVKYLYDGAFENCTSLQEVEFEGNTVLEYIGDNAFLNCSRLGYNFVISDEAKLTVTLPDTVTYLGASAFKGCSSLKYVVLGAGISEIKNSTFAECSELVKVIVKNDQAVVRACAFNGLDNEIVKIYKADGITLITLPNEAFGNGTQE